MAMLHMLLWKTISKASCVRKKYLVRTTSMRGREAQTGV